MGNGDTAQPPQAHSASGVSQPQTGIQRLKPGSPSLTPFPPLALPQRPLGAPRNARPARREGEKNNKSFNDTDATLNEAVLQFTLNRTLTYYKCVIRTIRFITPRVSFLP